MYDNRIIRFVVYAPLIALLFSVSCQGQPDNGGGGAETTKDDRLIWKAEIGITGLFKGVEFVIEGDRLYVVSMGGGLAHWDRFIEDPPKDQREGVYCLDAETGEVIWHTDIGEDPFSDIVLYEGRLYLYSRGSLLCIAADAGEIVWEYPLSEGIHTESLAVSPEAVYVGHQDKVLVIAHNGTDLLWEATVPIRVRSLHYDDGRLYVGAEGKWEEVPAYLFCFDAASGEETWRYEASGGHELDDQPVIVNDRLYLHSSEGRVYCLDPENGKKQWVQDFAEWDEEDEVNVINPMVGSPCLVGGRLYIGRSMNPGYVYCVNTETGDIVWKAKRYPEEPDARVTTAVVHSDGRLYYGWEGWSVETEGGIVLMRLSRASPPKMVRPFGTSSWKTAPRLRRKSLAIRFTSDAATGTFTA